MSTLQNRIQELEADITVKNRKIDELTRQNDELTELNEFYEAKITPQGVEIQDGYDLFTEVLSGTQITFHTDESDYIAVGRQFMDKYGSHLMAVSTYFPSNEYAIIDFILIDVHTYDEPLSAQPEIVEDGVIFTVGCEYAIKPPIPLSETSPWWAGNTSEYIEKEGWYKLSNVLKLKLDNSGYVSLVSLGTGF